MPTADNNTTSPRAARTRAGSTKAATKASGARRRNTGPARPARPAPRSTTVLVGDYAERAILIPVGAALIARERVLSSVNDAISSYSTPSRAQTQLRKFERRGTTARNRLEREVRKTRTRLERELRQRRRELDRRRDSVTKSVSGQVDRVSERVDRIQERVLNLV
jgi:hypothetical protein